MTRRGAVLLLLLAGCSPFALSQRPMDPPSADGRGRLVLRAVKGPGGEELARGYLFTVLDGTAYRCFPSRAEAETVLDGLEPGRYEVRVSGRGVSEYSCVADVRGGRETIVVFHIRSARNAEAFEEFAAVTGKTVFYVGAGVLYGLFYVSLELFLPDDDEHDGCSACGHSPCRCPRPPAASTAPKDQPKPRVRDLLKPERP